jgi:hypothetical protein
VNLLEVGIAITWFSPEGEMCALGSFPISKELTPVQITMCEAVLTERENVHVVRTLLI